MFLSRESITTQQTIIRLASIYNDFSSTILGESKDDKCGLPTWIPFM